METILNEYQLLFPHTSVADWFFSFLGLTLHVLLKMKNIPVKHFKWRLLIQDFLPTWIFTIIAIIICLGTIPSVIADYNTLDSALIGYSASSVLKQVFKSRLSNLGVKSPE